MSKSTYVQTELSAEEYRRFKSLAEERGIPLTAALREAAEEWMEQQRRVDPNDPLFDILERLDEESLPDTPRTNAATEDDLVDDWSGRTPEDDPEQIIERMNRLVADAAATRGSTLREGMYPIAEDHADTVRRGAGDRP
ncbi:MAG TPA: hypothetical protein VFJ06_05380 [Halococcus sp.]|nr:hypothetical protein [Halococcus sp.]